MTYISNFACLPDAFYKYSNTLFPSVIGGSEVMENGLLSGGKPRNDQSRLSWISSINFKCAKRVSCLPRIQNTLNKYSVVLLTLLSVLQTWKTIEYLGNQLMDTYREIIWCLELCSIYAVTWTALSIIVRISSLESSANMLFSSILLVDN